MTLGKDLVFFLWNCITYLFTVDLMHDVFMLFLVCFLIGYFLSIFVRFCRNGR